ncbi:Response regulatory domain-containing protein [Gammaproteobacteria bacterium]
MSGFFRILVVDDDDYQQALLNSMLGDNYEVITASSGEQAIDLARQYSPALVLMDISMPGLTGYQTCTAMKADDELAAIPVIFLSGLVELEDRLAAYDCGGEDFISKPCARVELRNKITITLRKIEERTRLVDEAKNAFSTAMTALSSAGEIGVVLGCLRESFGCADYASLIEVVLQSVSNFSLRASVQIRGMGGCLSRNELGDTSPLETHVLTALVGGGRIVDFNNRSAFNYEHVSILIRNMPTDDTDRCGRLRDHLAMLAEGINARVVALDAEFSRHAQQQAMILMIEKTHKTLLDIEKRHQGHKLRAATIMHKMVDRIEDTFFTLGLNEIQEKKILAMINDSVDKILRLYEEGLAIESHVKSVMDQLVGVGRKTY